MPSHRRCRTFLFTQDVNSTPKLFMHQLEPISPTAFRHRPVARTPSVQRASAIDEHPAAVLLTVLSYSLRASAQIQSAQNTDIHAMPLSTLRFHTAPPQLRLPAYQCPFSMLLCTVQKPIIHKSPGPRQCVHGQRQPDTSVLPAISQFSLRETQRIVLNIRKFSIYAGTTETHPPEARHIRTNRH